MTNEETIINKQIDINTIIELGRHLESQKEEYIRLINIDKTKNKNIPVSEQIYQYKNYLEPEIKYEITFKDNRVIQKSDYNWFIQNLNYPLKIKKIRMHFSIHYYDNSIDKANIIHRNLRETIIFYEDKVYFKVEGVELETEANKQYSYIKSILERGEDRFNKTIKNRTLRIESFCLAFGIILSYILFIFINVMKGYLPEIFVQILNNRYAIIIGQWIIALILGNILGYWIIMMLYKNILPRRKCSYYSHSSHKLVYEDDVENYTGKCEVNIGMYANSKKSRIIIEKIYRITKIILLVQVIVSAILFGVLK